VKRICYETIQTKKILQVLSPQNLIIDLHTFSAKSQPFAIVVDPHMIPLAQTTGLMHIVYMAHNIKNGHALIDYRPGISIETGFHYSPETIFNIIKILKNLKARIRHPAKIYRVFDVITQPGNYRNFLPHPSGFIPILAGEKAYPFFGLKAKLDQSLMLQFNHQL